MSLTRIISSSAFLWVTGFLFCSCRNIPLPASAAGPPTYPQPSYKSLSAPEAPVKRNKEPIIAPQLTAKTLSGIRFEGVTFDARSHLLRVVDQSAGPDSEYPNARSVVSTTGALLAINGGFFTPEGNPLGSVISAGKQVGSWNSTSSLGSGIYRVDLQGHASISRRKSFSEIAASEELLQAGPLLVENRKAILGLEDQKTASRTLLLNNGGDRWWIGIASPCTLADLGHVLARTSPAGWPVANALNLDGGRSSDLYVSPDLRGGPIERRGFFNRSVRNFLVLKAR